VATHTVKGVTHVDDAAIAVAAFTAALPDPREASTISAERALSLIGATAVWGGWSTDDDVLHAARSSWELPSALSRLR
jgi:hypothetical protein